MKYVFEVIGMGSKKYGGFEKYIVEEARQLRSKGYRLVVIFDREPLAQDYVDDLRRLTAEVEVLPQQSKLRFVKGFVKLLKKYRPEVVHTNFSSNVFLALPLARLYGARRRIATEHCLPVIDSLKLRIAMQLTTLFADHFLPVSKKSEEALMQGVFMNKDRIRTLYLGIPAFEYDRMEMRKRIGIDDHTFALMNIAYHHPVKGVDVLLRAMSVLVNEKGYEDIVLYQIGGSHTDGDTDKLRKLASELNIDSHIVWMGIRNDVPMLLSAGDLYVQPSRSEGIGLSIMEASMARLATVASDVGGIPEAAEAGNNAILVPPENPEALASAIEKLYSDAALRGLYGQRGHQIAHDKFSLQKSVSRLITDYYGL